MNRHGDEWNRHDDVVSPASNSIKIVRLECVTISGVPILDRPVRSILVFVLCSTVDSHWSISDSVHNIQAALALAQVRIIYVTETSQCRIKSSWRHTLTRRRQSCFYGNFSYKRTSAPCDLWPLGRLVEMYRPKSSKNQEECMDMTLTHKTTTMQ